MIFLLLACGKKVPIESKPNIPSELQPNASIELPNCNTKDYLYARGIGTSGSESVNNARQSISEQIVSSIQTNNSMQTEYIAKTRVFNGKKEDNSETIERFQNNVKISSSFTHLDLMKTVIEPVPTKGNYTSLVCLSKADSNQVLSDALSSKMKEFQNLHQQAMNKFNDNDIASFSIKYHKAMDMHSEIGSQLYVIHSVTGMRSPLEKPYMSAYEEFETTASNIRDDLALGLHLKGNVEYPSKSTNEKKSFDQPQLFVDAFRKGLESHALLVRTATKCQSGLSHHISLEVDANCPAYHPLGQAQCFITYKASLTDCKKNDMLELLLSDKKLQGLDRASNEKALYKAADSKELNAIMQQELRNYFPIFAVQ